jgi:hypothetical protein
MSRSIEGRRRRAATIKARNASPGDRRFQTCTIIGCGQPTAGLAIALCRKHLLHRQRHGSPFCPSPTAAILKPYLRAATSYIKSRRSDPYIKAALGGLGDLMRSAGQIVPATRLRGLPPAERSRVALARLRDAGIKPDRLLAITLAVHALIKHAPAKTHRIKEWRIVAIAKAAHRLASGDHQVWEAQDDSGRAVRLAKAMEKESDWVIDQHLDKVVAGMPQAGKH